MFGPRQNGPLAALLVAVALVVSGCSSAGKGPPTLAPAAIASQAAPVKGDKARFAFAPVNGAPVDVLRDMSVAMNREASSHKLQVVPNGDPSATYLVRGYLSAVSEGNGTTLVYVWDILDRNGVRLHRISGQESGKAASGDPWAGIAEPTITVAARKTMDALSQWVNAS
jgi:hypothetical protein